MQMLISYSASEKDGQIQELWTTENYLHFVMRNTLVCEGSWVSPSVCTLGMNPFADQKNQLLISIF
jgi:hypothetical protein